MKKAVATSTFNSGLIMDFNPMVTPNNVLVNALNATLVTMNGNESILQNDMGNGRVETAYLPDGYIPMGTCEFGDIIYIVSFNPLNNKCQIGCFPSPERNIDSDEISDLETSLSSSTFQKLKNGQPTGKLIANSVKRIVYQDTMNPGDKYLIYGDDISSGEKTLSDYGNTQHIHNKWPKLLKIHVVSIEDSGKITYLDSYTQWYDNLEKTENSDSEVSKGDYYIKKGTVASSQNEDLDEYRNKLKSNYSIFHSKISGKLALLCELEKITGFSCSWFYSNVTTDGTETVEENGTLVEKNVKAKDRSTQEYQIGFAINWETEDNNINPKYIVLTQSEWVDGQGLIGRLYTINSEGEETVVTSNEDYSNAYYKYSANENDPLPIAFGDGSEEYCYSKISRTYYLEDSSTYSRFITKVIPTETTYKIEHDISYDVQKDSIIKNIKKQGISDQPSHFSPLDDLTKDSENIYDYSTPITKIIFSPDKTGIYINPNTYSKGEYTTEYVTEGDTTTKVFSKDQSLQSEYYTSYNNNLYKLTKVTISEDILPEDIINNTFGYSVIKNDLLTYISKSNSSDTSTNETSEDNSTTKKENYIFKIPKNTNTVDLTNLVYHYQICPAMPYGILEEYAVDGYIDFSKVGTTNIELTEWRYYNYDNTSTLTWGLSAYTEENQSIQDITFEFIDATGPAAIMHINNKASYNGSFTNYIILNSTSNRYIDNIDYNDQIIYHKGLEVTNKNSLDFTKYTYIYETSNGLKELKEGDSTDNLTIYYNDAGILYSYLLYLVKITVRYGVQDSLGNYIESETKLEEFYRWFWTNDMFNEYYYTYKDYNDIYPQLNLSATVNYTQKDNFVIQNTKYESSEKKVVENVDENYKNLAATVQYVGLDGEANLEMNITTGLANSYGVFSLKGYTVEEDKTVNWDTPVKDMPVTIYVAKKYVENSTEPTILNSESSTTSNSRISEINSTSNKDKIDSTESEYGSELNTLLGLKNTTTSSELWENSAAYQNYKNEFYLDILDSSKSKLTELTEDEINSMDGNTYISYDSEETAFAEGYRKYETTVGHIDTFYISYASEELNYKPASLDILFQGISFSKYAIEYQNETKSLTTVYPLIYYENDLEKYNLQITTDNHIQFKYIYGLCLGNDSDGSHQKYIRFYASNEECVNNTLKYSNSDVFSTIDGGGDSGSWSSNKKETPDLYGDINGDCTVSYQVSTDSKKLYQYIPNFAPLLILTDQPNKLGGKDYRIIKSRYGNGNMTVQTNNNYPFSLTSLQDLSSLGKAPNINLTINDFQMIFLTIHDINNYVHVLNNVFDIGNYASKARKSLTFATLYSRQDNKKLSPADNRKIYIADLIASLLSQVYYTDGISQSVTYSNIGNYSYLSDHNIIFTNDIVVNITPKDLTTVETPDSTESNPKYYEYYNNDYLLFNGIDFTTYLDMIKAQTIVQWDEVTTNNVDVRIQRLSINSPLQVQLPYIQPTVEVINPQSIVYTLESEGSYILSEISAKEEKLYQLFNGELNTSVNKAEFKLFNHFTTSNGQLIESYDKDYKDSISEDLKTQLTFHTSNLRDDYVINNGELKLNGDLGSSSSYSFEGKQENWLAMSPIYKSDSLIYEAQTFS